MASGVRSLFGRFFDTAFGYAVGGAASSAIDPLVEPLAQAAWTDAVAAGDSRALQVADLAAMSVQGVMNEADAAVEAAKSGWSPDRFHRLFLVNGDPIAPLQALDLWNRGLIAESDVDRALLQSRLKPEWVETFKLLRAQLVQVADLAEMVVQGVLDQASATQAAARLGYDADSFGRLVRLAGNPPGPMELLDLWNRGVIDEARVDHGLLQSRLKPEWVEEFKRLRVTPPGLAAIVEARIKERLDDAQAAALAAEHGVEPATLALLVDAGGRPIATGEALTLYRRGQFTAAQVFEAIDRSDIRSQYAPDILKLATVYPSLFQIKQMLATGAISDALAADVLGKEGYPAELIAGVIAAGHGVKLANSRHLTQGAILDGYRTGGIARAQATEMLQGLGYGDDDVTVLLAFADYQRAHAYRTAVINVVKQRFLKHDLDESAASAALDAAGIPPDERDQYLSLWAFDLQSNPRDLTLAELVALLKAGIVDGATFEGYLPRLGFAQPEIGWLVELHVR